MAELIEPTNEALEQVYRKGNPYQYSNWIYRVRFPQSPAWDPNLVTRKASVQLEYLEEGDIYDRIDNDVSMGDEEAREVLELADSGADWQQEGFEWCEERGIIPVTLEEEDEIATVVTALKERTYVVDEDEDPEELFEEYEGYVPDEGTQELADFKARWYLAADELMETAVNIKDKDEKVDVDGELIHPLNVLRGIDVFLKEHESSLEDSTNITDPEEYAHFLLTHGYSALIAGKNKTLQLYSANQLVEKYGEDFKNLPADWSMELIEPETVMENNKDAI